MKLLNLASLAGCWLLGLLFTWAALVGLADQVLGNDPRGASAFAELMALAILCAFVVRTYGAQCGKSK